MTETNSCVAETPCRIVVFDLGGVLARINHSWQAAAALAGVSTCLNPDDATPFVGMPWFEAYQMNAMDLDTYLQELSGFTGCPVAEALAIHNAIIIDEYPGVLELVLQLEQAGIATGCLSNTNAPHWSELIGENFPAVARLRYKMASHLVGVNKPDPYIFRLYARTFGFHPSEIIFFDDNRDNVAAAGEVGFRAHRIDPEGEPATQMRHYLELNNVPI